MRCAEPRSFQCSPAQNENRARTVADTASREELAERTDSLVRDLVARFRFSVHTMKRLIDLPGADEPRLAGAWVRG